MALVILIPAWNEADQISTLFDRIISISPYFKMSWRVILVDDGSTDSTVLKAEAFQSSVPLTILSHPINQGVSAAFRTGFDAAMADSESGDVIITLEANKNADLSIIPRMLALAEHGYDLVLASCYAPGGAVVGDPFTRLFLSKSVNSLLQILFPFGKIHTYTSFFRLWTFDLVRQIHDATNGRYFRQEGFVCMADMLLEARKIRGMKVHEVPLVLKSDIRDQGSKMNIGRTVRGYIKLILSQLVL